MNASEYPWGCSCGESFRTEDHAWACRKCLQYLSDEDYFIREVIYFGTTEEKAPEAEPISYCPKCSAPWYSLEGYCGRCHY